MVIFDGPTKLSITHIFSTFYRPPPYPSAESPATYLVFEDCRTSKLNLEKNGGTQ